MAAKIIIIAAVALVATACVAVVLGLIPLYIQSASSSSSSTTDGSTSMSATLTDVATVSSSTRRFIIGRAATDESCISGDTTSFKNSIINYIKNKLFKDYTTTVTVYFACSSSTAKNASVNANLTVTSDTKGITSTDAQTAFVGIGDAVTSAQSSAPISGWKAVSTISACILSIKGGAINKGKGSGGKNQQLTFSGDNLKGWSSGSELPSSAVATQDTTDTQVTTTTAAAPSSGNSTTAGATTTAAGSTTTGTGSTVSTTSGATSSTGSTDSTTTSDTTTSDTTTTDTTTTSDTTTSDTTTTDTTTTSDTTTTDTTTTDTTTTSSV